LLAQLEPQRALLLLVELLLLRVESVPVLLGLGLEILLLMVQRPPQAIRLGVGRSRDGHGEDEREAESPHFPESPRHGQLSGQGKRAEPRATANSGPVA
jgi:hypothetical protein